MSEYQYYEFQAIERPLTSADRSVLRDISSRAEITATSFTNHYEWGDFKGDALEFMERWFDLHMYFANWGTRSFFVRVPGPLVDETLIGQILEDCGEEVGWRTTETHLILHITQGYEERPMEYIENESEYLASLSGLRADVLDGDLRLFYLAWLLESYGFEDDALEPLSGMGPLTDEHRAFVDFFDLDEDLVDAAAENTYVHQHQAPTPETARNLIASLPDEAKTELLCRVYDDDAFVGPELRQQVRLSTVAKPLQEEGTRRTLGELRARAKQIRVEKDAAALAAAEKARKIQEQKLARERRIRLDTLIELGQVVWESLEVEINRRNNTGYTNAAAMLIDLHDIAQEQRTEDEFAERLRVVRLQHAKKLAFIERIKDL